MGREWKKNNSNKKKVKKKQNQFLANFSENFKETFFNDLRFDNNDMDEQIAVLTLLFLSLFLNQNFAKFEIIRSFVGDSLSDRGARLQIET